MKLSRLLFFTGTIFFLSCNNVSQKRTPKATNKTDTVIKSLSIAKDRLPLQRFNWTELSNTDRFEIRYLQLNFLSFPTNEMIGNSIIRFADSLNTKSVLLTNEQVLDLFNLINEKSNFSEGDCGTFHLNAGFFVLLKGKICATIDIGCNYAQWNFSSENPNSKFGFLNEAGVKKMTSLLDDINLKGS